jgi:predicted nucleotidyltransferase
MVMGVIKNFRIRGGDKQVRKYIKDLCEQIVRVANPEKIILFGSYAYGKPTEDSDIDLLVVMPVEGHPAYKAAEIRMKVKTPMAWDLLVRTPEFVAEEIEQGDLFMRKVAEQGKVIYEAEYAKVG